ncbi:RagB/SusD family nutrient uptake outer membrane protein [Sphingobacterium chuzhouense]|uniref:RagB/SusD family nutrient uptake outer membrane protein n=1 Tax=Sphingobacterium chuzhouense TaxID=1742264 RepID=A0ABR7XUR6_9SPHI|nr:RagB/SusD family nutrient uptake outer membrane protein [Sphingobacterium chuzhouense]MBD1422795.1 RagB/SusD family nutrient uptake outer membrane protein [Sphingobacterium chuzhouense]
MRKNVINYILSLLILMSACSIDITPTDRYTEEVIWDSENSIDLYVNGLYTEFRTFEFGRFPIGYDNATDGLTDIMKYTSQASGNGTVNILASDASRYTASTPGITYWASAYTRIRRINEFIYGLQNYSNTSEEQKLAFEAEARFIRGYVYFWLARINGSFVIIDDLEGHTSLTNDRSSEDECYNFIAEDFAFAAQHLPETRLASATGRATKGAALSLLARTWLYAASIAEFDRNQYNNDPKTGIPNEKAKTYYENAIVAAEAVVALANQGVYDLESNFAEIFTKSNNKESIFRIDYVTQFITHQYDFGFVPPGDAPGQAMVYGVPTAELVDAFEMADGSKFNWANGMHAANPYENRESRFYATILYNGATWKGRTLNTTDGGGEDGFVQIGTISEPRKTVTGYYAKKLLDPGNTSFIQNRSTQSWHEIRYAEVLLILSEAQILSEKLTEGRTTLNILRNKRGLPNVTANTREQLFEAIQHERMVELAFEGHRYWDLRRWRLAHVKLNNIRFTGHKINNLGSGYMYEKVVCDTRDREFIGQMYYLPIPLAEIQRNTAITQIQGW